MTEKEHTVEFVGTEEAIEVSERQTILDACIEEGLAQEYSCRVGMCLRVPGPTWYWNAGSIRLR
jgi:ferredoxin